jgi:isopentenyl diphosphate isomerase/L-lactate dehydrogenase-like FMN-dependent dehydrogenase
VLAMLESDVRRTMALIGASTLADLTPDLVARPTRF